MKKICFFSGDITRSGGTERVSIIIANELVKQGKYDICFLSLCEQSPKAFYDIHEEIRRYSLGNKWLNPGLGYLPLIPKLRKFFKEHDIDVIIDIDIVLDVLSIPASCGLKAKVLSWEHFNCDYEMSLFYRRAILLFSVKHSDYVITLTEGDKLRYGELTGRRERIEAIYNPMKEGPDAVEQEKENWIITAVRLVHDKGIDYLAIIAAAVLTKHPDWKWFVLGEGEDRAILEQTIQEQGLEGRLIAPGLVPDVGEYLSKAKLFVLTSRVEGLPMCLIEAKTYHLPCISFDIPTGPNEIIEHGENGYLVQAFDCEDMIDKIETLISQEELRNKFRDNAYKNVDKFFLQTIMENWNRVLEKLCE